MTDREDLYQQAIDLYRSTAHKRRSEIDAGIRAVVDLALEAQSERPDWEVLQEAAKVVGRVEMQTEYILARIEWLTETANVLEAEHQAAQEKAERESAREKLIEQAAKTLAYVSEPNDEHVSRDEMWDEYLTTFTQIRYCDQAVALIDAGWRPAPTTDGGAA